MFSGGLDSILAAKLMENLGYDVVPINFKTPFFGPESAEKSVKYLKNELVVIDITKDLFKVIENPKHGFGKNMNPCIDCHALMARKLGELLEEYDAKFVITGEVLGQRPKSQKKFGLEHMAKESGIGGLIVRPLSGKLLAPTIPETEGWINREDLLDIQGRTRRRQIELAEEFGIDDYPSSGGGCLLTDPQFSIRLRDLMESTGIQREAEVELLKYGRHFRVSEDTKIIVGRNKDENEQMLSLMTENMIGLFLGKIPGPVAVLIGDTNKENIRLAASFVVFYSKLKGNIGETVYWGYGLDRGNEVIVDSAKEEEVNRIMVV